ncbi:hypothetical protein [Oxynema aestuarii]|uniref:Uncharacterized protein n=1 Tax=Oxynema aestuarii AP17 TaxID=2064643 RepID=A0A6H1TXK7_9CYAN|nr:hypothetical protein [Oxynema aestuarii]QIZ70660.1 hypothetical protein HCG48_08775 [Oxynema aestuarii AP17]
MPMLQYQLMRMGKIPTGVHPFVKSSVSPQDSPGRRRLWQWYRLAIAAIARLRSF